jgi:hypothetical protein
LSLETRGWKGVAEAASQTSFRDMSKRSVSNEKIGSKVMGLGSSGELRDFRSIQQMHDWSIWPIRGNVIPVPIPGSTMAVETPQSEWFFY